MSVRLGISSASAAIHNGLMNMTYLALRFSRFVNGVAMQHGKVSQQMFPEYRVAFRSPTAFTQPRGWPRRSRSLFDKEIPRVAA